MMLKQRRTTLYQ